MKILLYLFTLCYLGLFNKPGKAKDKKHQPMGCISKIVIAIIICTIAIIATIYNCTKNAGLKKIELHEMFNKELVNGVDIAKEVIRNNPNRSNIEINKLINDSVKKYINSAEIRYDKKTPILADKYLSKRGYIIKVPLQFK